MAHRMGIARRNLAVWRCAALVQQSNLTALADIASHARLTVPQAAWCVQRASSLGWLPGKTLDLAHAIVFPTPPPVPAVAASPMIARDDSLAFLDEHDYVAVGAEPDDASDEEEEESAAEQHERIRDRLTGFGKLVHRRTCEHCGYYGRMGVLREVSHTGTRAAGQVVNAVMGKSPLARWVTRDLRGQKNEWEAECPNCGGKNYFNVY